MEAFTVRSPSHGTWYDTWMDLLEPIDPGQEPRPTWRAVVPSAFKPSNLIRTYPKPLFYKIHRNLTKKKRKVDQPTQEHAEGLLQFSALKSKDFSIYFVTSSWLRVWPIRIISRSQANTNDGSAATRVREFFRMNLPDFLGSKVGEDPHNFIDEIKKILGVIQVTVIDYVELASYQWKDVSHIWFTQWKDNRGSVAHVKEERKELSKDVHRLALLGFGLTATSDSGVIVQNGSESSLVVKGHLCFPNVGELRKHILTEAYNSRYSIHLGATKMYRDLQKVFRWNGMKRDIADFVAKILIVNRLRQHDSIWVLVDRVTKSAHFLAVKTTNSAEDYTKFYIMPL
ncbi:hypothetical protein MTR67_031363 [Solanum verrucosum]|uniref:Integrase zinc-binding domain-containing protein n=1 Tax=Solanum verrucosum TaxID=315347 RepID=A0AAF0U2A9_SOLVR|nr:hypothetical protein MTR67_031363 [Solanum verrucosum]